MGVGGHRHVPAALAPGKRSGTHCTRTWDWMGPRAGLERRKKSRPPLGFDSQTIQPVASRHTDCAMPTCTYTAWGISKACNSLA